MRATASLFGDRLLVEFGHSEAWLDIGLYGMSSLKLSRYISLARLYGFEHKRTGGRFQNYSPHKQPHVVRKILPMATLTTYAFEKSLNWISDNVEGDWSFDVEAYELDGVSSLHFVMEFEIDEEAMLYKLTLC
jgi:hypothetical protein